MSAAENGGTQQSEAADSGAEDEGEGFVEDYMEEQRQQRSSKADGTATSSWDDEEVGSCQMKACLTGRHVPAACRQPDDTAGRQQAFYSLMHTKQRCRPKVAFHGWMPPF